MTQTKTQRQFTFFYFSLTGVFIVILISFFAVILYPQQMHHAKTSLKEKNGATAVFIESYFREIMNVCKMLALNKEVIEVPYLDKAAGKRVLDIFRDFQQTNPNIYFIYGGYSTNWLHINGYKQPPGFDVRERPYYRAVMDAPYRGKMVAGLLYEEIKSKELLFSTAHILESPVHGFTGVVVIDSYTGAIAKQLSHQSSLYKTSYSFIADGKYQIIVHPDSSLIKTSLLDVVSTDSHVPKNGFFEYTFNGTKQIAYVSYLPFVG